MRAGSYGVVMSGAAGCAWFERSASDRMDPDDTESRNHVERRKRPRPGDDSSNWEAIALRRVAERVQSLSRDGRSAAGEFVAESWEDAAVRVLERHLRGQQSRD